MTKSKLWAAEVLEEFPEELRERAVAHLLEQGEKFRVLKKLVEEGLADVEAGRVSDWDPNEIWAMAEELAEQERKLEIPREAGE
jgi:predicted transcriptional regulator